MRRFRWKRRRAALALLPALAMMITAGIAGASVVPSTGTAPEATASGSPATGISLEETHFHVVTARNGEATEAMFFRDRAQAREAAGLPPE